MYEDGQLKQSLQDLKKMVLAKTEKPVATDVDICNRCALEIDAILRKYNCFLKPSFTLSEDGIETQVFVEIRKAD